MAVEPALDRHGRRGAACRTCERVAVGVTHSTPTISRRARLCSCFAPAKLRYMPRNTHYESDVINIVGTEKTYCQRRAVLYCLSVSPHEIFIRRRWGLYGKFFFYCRCLWYIGIFIENYFLPQWFRLRSRVYFWSNRKLWEKKSLGNWKSQLITQCLKVSFIFRSSIRFIWEWQFHFMYHNLLRYIITLWFTLYFYF